MNKDTYRFDDFTYKNYEVFLSLAKKYYTFAFFNNHWQYEKYIVLRHDIDYSVDAALRIAEIEHKLNVKSTFFFNLRCSFYNMLEKEELRKIIYIKSLDHNIGIHFDINSYEINNEARLEDTILYEKNIFEKFVGNNVDTFSFHNPTLIDNNIFEKERYAGLINVYSKEWKNKKYCSDSNGYWRYERLFDLIEEKKYSALQILLHPGHWSEKVLSPKERIEQIIYSKAAGVWENYKNLLEKNGRKIIDWE